jgi:hypothetical protein
MNGFAVDAKFAVQRYLNREVHDGIYFQDTVTYFADINRRDEVAPLSYCYSLRSSWDKESKTFWLISYILGWEALRQPSTLVAVQLHVSKVGWLVSFVTALKLQCSHRF